MIKGKELNISIKYLPYDFSPYYLMIKRNEINISIKYLPYDFFPILFNDKRERAKQFSKIVPL
jgi:hypothetical protein